MGRRWGNLICDTQNDTETADYIAQGNCYKITNNDHALSHDDTVVEYKNINGIAAKLQKYNNAEREGDFLVMWIKNSQF